VNLRFERNRETRTWRLVSERDPKSPSPFFALGGVRSNQEGSAKTAAEKRGSPARHNAAAQAVSPRKARANDTDDPELVLVVTKRVIALSPSQGTP
jgi:hypothetical protein